MEIKAQTYYMMKESGGLAKDIAMRRKAFVAYQTVNKTWVGHIETIDHNGVVRQISSHMWYPGGGSAIDQTTFNQLGAEIKPERTVYINIYADGYCFRYDNLEAACEDTTDGLIARKKVTFMEGEYET